MSELGNFGDFQQAPDPGEMYRKDYGDLVVERATLEALSSCVDVHEVNFFRPDGSLAEVSTPNHPGIFPGSKEEFPWSAVVVTPEHPGVIYDDGAAFCSPTIVFDETGRAVHLHESPLGDTRSFDNLKDRYISNLARYINWEEQITFAIAGSNIWLDEDFEKPDPVDQVALWTDSRLREVFPKARSISLIAKRRENQHKVADPSLVPPEEPTTRGYVFIPQYVARDRVNHLMPIIDSDGYDRLRPFIGIA